ncbi:MAG: hypothetical protein ACFB4I_17735 [Cyanophyceae cyanobacterium]
MAIAFFLFCRADIVYADGVINGSDEINLGFFDFFWTLSGIALAIGAAKEYDISISRRRYR